MKKVLIIGATGMVGSRFTELAKGKFDITPADQAILDITNQSAVEKYFQDNKFDAVVNLAAYTDVSGAEKQWNDKEGLAWKLNALAPGYLGEVLEKYRTFFVHFSTDFVFEGLEDSKGPFDEDAALPKSSDNLCWYGYTKLLGEEAVREKCKNSAIVRIANPFVAHFAVKPDFARKILELYDAGNLYPLFTDQIITPIFIDDLVEPLSKIIETEQIGNFHIVSSDTIAYYDFGDYLLEKAKGVKGAPQKASVIDFMKTPGRNKRPIWGGLATEKTQNKLGMKFRTWREMVNEFISQL